MNYPVSLLFVALTFCCWGGYAVLLRNGQQTMNHDWMRAFVGVGIAYFLIAVMVPAFLLGRKPEKGFWSFQGTMMSFFAGSVGAIGALGVLLAVAFHGDPIYVMPLVFGLAPVVNTLVTGWIGKSLKDIKPMFVVGLVLVVSGAVGVLVTKPTPVKKAVTEKVEKAEKVEKLEGSFSMLSFAEKSEADKSEKETSDTKSEKSKESVKGDEPVNVLAVVGSIILAALCWGSYGPFLHIGQMKMGGSRLRPFLCVGIAYLIIAVVLPLMMISARTDNGSYTWLGMTWSIGAGAAGAIGALGIIMAFNYGGKPIFVMPLVFGFAPVVNTLFSILQMNAFDRVKPEFYASIVVVILGAVTVLLFPPKSKGHGPAPSAPPTPPSKTPPAVEAPKPEAKPEAAPSAEAPSPSDSPSPSTN